MNDSRTARMASGEDHPQRSFGLWRLTLVLLAGFGIVPIIVWLSEPVVYTQPIRDPLGVVRVSYNLADVSERVGTALRYLFNVLFAGAAVIAGCVAIAAARSKSDGVAVRSLGWAFGSLSAFIGVFFFALALNPRGMIGQLTPSNPSYIIAVSLLSAVFGFGVTNLLTFCANFPQPLDIAALRRHTAGKTPRKWLGEKLPTEVELHRYERCIRFLSKRWAPLFIAIPTVVLVLLSIRDGDTAGGGDMAPAMWIWVTTMFAVTFAHLLLRIEYSNADQAGRSKLLWIFGGMLASWWSVVALGIAAFVAGPVLGEGGYYFYLVAEFLLLPPLATLIVVLGFAIAVFYAGAIDPGLIIRKSSIYAFLGLSLTAAFIIVEQLVSSVLVTRAGFPGFSSEIAAAMGIALIFNPVRNRVERISDRLVDRLIGARALSDAPTAELVVLFSDLDGFTRATRENEKDALAAVSLFHATATRLADKYRGRIVKTIGDAVLAVFETSDNAVQFAMELSERVPNAAAALDMPAQTIRSGIHAGAVIVDRKGDVFGDVVNIASRLQNAAGAGEVMVSDQVFDGLSGAREKVQHQRVRKDVAGLPEPLDTILLRSVPITTRAGAT